MDAAERYHLPVMVHEIVELLAPAGEGVILDGTVGGGGHSAAILARYPACSLIAVDRDPEAIAAAGMALKPFGGRVEFRQGRFDEVLSELVREGRSLGGALFDLGVSGHHLDEDARGFTFRPRAPLDMRMSGGALGGPTAADLLNTAREEELQEIFRAGEEPQFRRLAKAVALLRQDRPFLESEDLVQAMAKAFRRSPDMGDRARVFQALRIAVNQELESLDRALPLVRDLLHPGGVLLILTYHSLEDRRVKQAFRSWADPCVCPRGLPVCACGRTPYGEPIHRKGLRPSSEEVERNSRARSATLRSWRRAA